MKKRTFVGLLTVCVLIMTLGLTGCDNKTAGQGVFVDTDDDGSMTYTNVSFRVQAQSIGEAYESPIGDAGIIYFGNGYYAEDVDLSLIHFQPAKGRIQLSGDDFTGGIKINCNIDGTFYVNPEDYQSAHSFYDDQFLYSGYSGSCRVPRKMGLPDVEKVYILAGFLDYIGEDTAEQDRVALLLSPDPIIENGVLQQPLENAVLLGGAVVEGAVVIVPK